MPVGDAAQWGIEAWWSAAGTGTGEQCKHNAAGPVVSLFEMPLGQSSGSGGRPLHACSGSVSSSGTLVKGASVRLRKNRPAVDRGGKTAGGTGRQSPTDDGAHVRCPQSRQRTPVRGWAEPAGLPFDPENPEAVTLGCGAHRQSAGSRTRGRSWGCDR